MGFPVTLTTLCLLIALPLSAVANSHQSEERPRLQDYESEEAFVRDVLAWEKRQRQPGTTQQAAPHASGQDKPDDSDDWHHVTGPENLDEALRNAYGYEQPNYKEKYRFNRTTHISFPLERLPAGQLSRQAITGGLRDELEAADERSMEPLPELRTALQEAAKRPESEEILRPMDEAFTTNDPAPWPGPRVEMANP